MLKVVKEAPDTFVSHIVQYDTPLIIAATQYPILQNVLVDFLEP